MSEVRVDEARGDPLVAAVPCRLGAEGLELLLVTSRFDGAWGLPKGRARPGEDAAAAAERSAYEDAGVRGRVGVEPLGVYEHRRGRARRTVRAFALHVSRVLEEFPGRGKRQREWVALDRAAERLGHMPDLLELLETLRRDGLPRLPEDSGCADLWRRPRGARPIICFDVDDTLLGADETALPGAVDVCEALIARGCALVASTARLDPVWAGVPRVARVRGLLRAATIPIEDVRVEVPAADLYVDDKGWRFDGDWDGVLDAARSRRRGGRVRLSVALAGALCGAEGGPRPEARSALERMGREGIDVVVSLGNFRPVGKEGEDRVEAARDWLATHGLCVHRVHPGKVSSNLYVDPHAFSFAGDWSEAQPELLERLGEPGAWAAEV